MYPSASTMILSLSIITDASEASATLPPWSARIPLTTCTTSTTLMLPSLLTSASHAASPPS